ncbi:MAG TPA: di-heme oxidoredictase family protein, partial [Nitrospira sp.]
MNVFARPRVLLFITAISLLSISSATEVLSQLGKFTARDPGVRGGGAGAGGMLPNLSTLEQQIFGAAKEVFQDVASVQGTIPNTEAGLGPRFNLDSCAGCHASPAIGGSSPALNPQIEVAKKAGAVNEVPSFIQKDGPIREVRFKLNPDGTPDGGVHALFTITGRSDASGCFLHQPDFRSAVAAKNVVFRIPTPVFGLGLIEAIDDDAILANMQANASTKQSLGIVGRVNRTSGRPNTSGNDGTITRFGWKGQNKSLEIFSGEAYNVEQGVTNDLFPQERDEAAGCRSNPTPESSTHFEASGPLVV